MPMAEGESSSPQKVDLNWGCDFQRTQGEQRVRKRPQGRHSCRTSFGCQWVACGGQISTLPKLKLVCTYQAGGVDSKDHRKWGGGSLPLGRTVVHENCMEPEGLMLDLD